MLKLLKRQGVFRLLRRQEQHHRDLRLHFIGQTLQEFPNFVVAIDAVRVLKIGIDDTDPNGHGVLTLDCDVSVWVSDLVMGENPADTN
jgi:hypothetical protein